MVLLFSFSTGVAKHAILMINISTPIKPIVAFSLSIQARAADTIFFFCFVVCCKARLHGVTKSCQLQSVAIAKGGTPAARCDCHVCSAGKEMVNIKKKKKAKQNTWSDQKTAYITYCSIWTISVLCAASHMWWVLCH